MAKKIALTLGIIFVIVGILGFISNPLVGDAGVFQTNTAHDLVHIISGIIFIIVAYKSAGAVSKTLKTFGIIYLIVAILGFFTDSIVGVIAVNGADNWLHIVLAIVLFAGGVLASKGDSSPAPMSSNPTPTSTM